jgi:hypothetical protein
MSISIADDVCEAGPWALTSPHRAVVHGLLHSLMCVACWLSTAKFTWQALLGGIQAAGLHAGAIGDARRLSGVHAFAGGAGLAAELLLAGLVGAAGALCAGRVARSGLCAAGRAGLRHVMPVQLVSTSGNCSRHSHTCQEKEGHPFLGLADALPQCQKARCIRKAAHYIGHDTLCWDQLKDITSVAVDGDSPTWQRWMAYALRSRTAVQQECFASTFFTVE